MPVRGQEPGGAHPHLVVDQVQDGVVGHPVQGEAGQPLLQHLQQLPDGRAAGEQLRGKHHTQTPGKAGSPSGFQAQV